MPEQPKWVQAIQALQRQFVLCALTGLLGYLVLQGNEQAVAGVIGAWGVLAGNYFGERTALKKPGNGDSG